MNISILRLLLLVCILGVKPGDIYANPQSAKEDIRIADALIDSADKYYNVDYEKFYKYANEALQISQNAHYGIGIADANKKIGVYFFMTGKPDKSLEFLFQSLEFYRSKKMKKEEGLVLRNIGIAFYYLGDMKSTTEYSMESIKIFQSLGDTKNEAQGLGLLGEVCITYGEEEKAIIYFRKAVVLFEKSNETERVNSVISYIGKAFYILNQYDSAGFYLEKALSYYQKYRPVDINVSESYRYLGLINYHRGQYAKALKQYNLGLKTIQQIGPNLEIEVVILLDLAQLHLRKKKYAEALEYAGKAEKLAAKSHPTFLIEINRTYYKIYKELGKPYQALIYHEKVMEGTDSAYAAKNEKHGKEFEAKYRFQENQNQILQLKTDNEAIKLRSSLLALGILLALTLAFLLFYLLYNKNRQIKQKEKFIEQEKAITKLNQDNQEQLIRLIEKDKDYLQKELSLQHEELLFFSLTLAKQNEVMMNVVKRLKDITRMRGVTTNLVTEFLNLANEVERNTETKSWNDLKDKFIKLNPNFIENLNKICNSLSANDIKLATLIRMNLSPKDIANLTFISLNSVYISRWRLRKKLGIDDDDKLYNFLISIES